MNLKDECQLKINKNLHRAYIVGMRYKKPKSIPFLPNDNEIDNYNEIRYEVIYYTPIGIKRNWFNEDQLVKK